MINIRYWSANDSLEWNAKSILEFDSKGASTLMGPYDSCSKLIFLDDIIYEG